MVLALVRFGLVTYEFMARTRPYAIVLIFILATIITPTPDILTLIAMSLPMCLLYESCIWIAWFMQRRTAREDRRLIAWLIRIVAYRFLFAGFAFVLGAVVGSFLERLHLSAAARSFGQRTAPIVLSVVQETDSRGTKIFRSLAGSALRGRCANCGSRIAFRYFAGGIADRASLSRRSG